MSSGTETKKLKNKNLSAIVYAVFGVITLAIFLPLFVWSFFGRESTDVEILEAEVLLAENVRREYLVGETFSTEGISLNVGTRENPQIVQVSECEVDADLSAAGNRKVTLTYAPNQYTNYVGSYNIKVYFVRNLYAAMQPETVTVNADGTFSTDEGFELCAELDSVPGPSSGFERVSGAGKESVIRLTPSLYSTKAVESVSVEGYYAASVFCGNLTYSFNFFHSATRTFLVQSEKNVVIYENMDTSSSASLKLIVTQTSESYQSDCTGESAGYYVYTAEDGAESIYDFRYELTEAEELFKSPVSAGGIANENKENERYSVRCCGDSFTVRTDLWESAVVNGVVYTDGEYKLVVDSEARILELTNCGEAGKETLTLYISDYTFDMSTGSGISKGFYIYTDENGAKQKFRFFMQTWTWTYVPLSARYADAYAEGYIGDYMHNSEKPEVSNYTGPMFADVHVYTRENGWQNIQFTIDMASLLKAAYNMK